MKNKKSIATDRHILFEDTSSVYSEAFQNIQVNLDFSSFDNKSKVIAVTSSVPHEGKSTVVANLAYIYGKKEFKVLVIDLDLRKSSLHRFFHVENDKGITDLCVKKAEESDILKHTEHLDIVTSGTHTPFVGKLLESNALTDFIEQMKKKYDYIFIDTPPVLASSDALLISRFVDQFLLVIQYGRTKKSDLNETVRQFKNNNIEISGVVMSNVANKRGQYGYSYNYQYTSRDKKK